MKGTCARETTRLQTQEVKIKMQISFWSVCGGKALRLHPSEIQSKGFQMIEKKKKYLIWILVRDPVWHNVAWCGMTLRDVMERGVALHDVAWRDTALWFKTRRFDMHPTTSAYLMRENLIEASFYPLNIISGRILMSDWSQINPIVGSQEALELSSLSLIHKDTGLVSD